MGFSRSKTTTIAVALFLMFAIAFSLVALPAANAHTPAWGIPTHAYIHVMPNPVGVDQTVTVYMWLDQLFGVGFGAADSAAIGNDYRFHDYQLTITKPDGKTETQTFGYISDPTSNQYYKYTPDQVGEYTFNFTFPGQAYAEYGHNPASVLVGDSYLSSTASTTLTVQQEPIPGAVGSPPLPTEYWTRPIYGENTGWWSISSNWLGTGAPVLSATGSGDISAFTFSPNLPWGSAMQRYPGDAVGPQTSHVMWTKPLQFGGVVGGNSVAIQGNTYFEGSAYNQRYTNPIIIAGRLYYTEPVSFTGTNSGPTVCVDLRTGEVIWSRTDVPALSFGYVYDVEDQNQHGVYPPILFTSNFGRAFDAFTGDPLFNVTGVPRGMEARGPSGEHLRYVISNAGTTENPDYYLAEWNSSKLWNGQGFAPGGTGYSPVPDTTTTTTWHWVNTTTWVDGIATVTSQNVTTTTTAVDGSTSNRYDWNVSISELNTLPAAPAILAGFYDNMLLCMSGTYPSAPSSWTGAGSSAPYTYIGVNLNATRASRGKVLWSNPVNAPSGNLTVYYAGADPTVNVFVETRKETLNFVGYSLTTGKQIWDATPSQESFDYYGQPGPAQPYGQVAYGKLYSSGYGGTVYCYDLTNGDLLWTYGNGGEGNSTRAGLNTPYGVYPTYINAIGNGIIYLVTTEHTIETPIYKGALARAINATDGTEIWTLSAYTGEFISMSYAIADGYATLFNGYGNQIYVVGRGPSATTVTASPKVSVHGDSVLVEGTVTDISAGTTQDEQAARFPNGVPAVADENMTEWMGYVYQQKPCPTDVTGVEVVIEVLDPNNNYYEVGRTTSDASGMFKASFTPEVPGEYTIIASFAGSEAYYGSYAETAINVENAPAATPAPTPTPAPMTDTYVTGFSIAIIIAIAIVGILLLRKRP
jgi:outer membrane protein assembly factor BamB